MKKTIVILICSLIVVSSIFGLQTIYKARNRQSGNETSLDTKTVPLKTNAVVVKTENLPMKTEAVKTNAIQDNDFVIGQKLADSLLQNCALFSGTIKDEKSNESEHTRQVDLHIDEWLFGKRANEENNTQLVFSSWVTAKMSPADNPLQNVHLEKNGKLLVAYCSQSKYYRLIVSEENYFPSIREIIKYHSSKTNEDTFETIPQIPDTQDNFVLAGYLTRRIWRLGSIGNINGNALLLTELLGSRLVPKNQRDDIRHQLTYLISSEDTKLLQSTRETIIEKLVEMGSSENDEVAEQSILSLIELIKAEKISFRQYLNEENSTKFNQNYQSLVITKISADDRKNFEKQLPIN